MRLLDRYLLRELLLPLAYCLLGFLISFIAFDLFSSLAEFQKNNLTAGDILEYYLDRTPEFLVTSFVVPMSLLLALLYALTNHARHHELTAMRAAAIPLWRMTLPYFVVGLLFSIGVAFVYYLIIIFVNTFRDKASAHPELLMWLPNALFLTIGAFLMYRLSRR